MVDYSVSPFSYAEYEKGEKMKAVPTDPSLLLAEVMICPKCTMSSNLCPKMAGQELYCPKCHTPSEFSTWIKSLGLFGCQAKKMEPKFKVGDRVKVLTSAYTGILNEELDRSKVYTVSKLAPNGCYFKECAKYVFDFDWLVLEFKFRAGDRVRVIDKVLTGITDLDRSKTYTIEEGNVDAMGENSYTFREFSRPKYSFLEALLVLAEEPKLPELTKGLHRFRCTCCLGDVSLRNPPEVIKSVEPESKSVPVRKLVGFTKEAYEKFKETPEVRRLYERNLILSGIVGHVVEYESGENADASVRWHKFYRSEDHCDLIMRYNMIADVSKLLPLVKWVSNELQAIPGHFIGEPVGVTKDNYDALKKSKFIGMYEVVDPEFDKFAFDPTMEALRDRTIKVEVPFLLDWKEEKKMLEAIKVETEMIGKKLVDYTACPHPLYKMVGYTAQSEYYFGKANNPYSLIGRVVEFSYFEKNETEERHQVWIDKMLMHERDIFKTSHDWGMRNNGLIPVEWVTNIYDPAMPDAKNKFYGSQETKDKVWKDQQEWLKDKFIGEPFPSGLETTAMPKENHVPFLKASNMVGVYRKIADKPQSFSSQMAESGMKKMMEQEDKRFLEAITGDVSGETPKYYQLPIAEWQVPTCQEESTIPKLYYKDRKPVTSKKLLELCAKFATGDFTDLKKFSVDLKKFVDLEKFSVDLEKFSVDLVAGYSFFTLDEIKEALVIISSSYLDKHGDRK